MCSCSFKRMLWLSKFWYCIFVLFPAVKGADYVKSSGNSSHHHHHLPICSNNDISNGYWLNVTSELFENSTQFATVSRHFYNGGPGEALNFSQVWLPHNCKYHRFTNHSLHTLINHVIHKSISNSSLKIPIMPDGRLHLTFIGDSTTRGTFCGICRIFGGSEVVGPLDNEVCGNDNVKHSQVHWKWYDLNIGSNLLMTFRHERTFNLPKNENKHMDWPIEWAITKTQPLAVVVNTGAWDFDWSLEHHGNTPDKLRGHEECTTADHKATSLSRSDYASNHIVHELSWQAVDAHVKLIYRNNHYNHRFGVLCADEGFEKMLNGTAWNLLDTRNISSTLNLNDILQDGFHFSRHQDHSVQAHLAARAMAVEKHKQYPGQLEMQIIQHLLNLIFSEFLIELHGNKQGEEGRDNV